MEPSERSLKYLEHAITVAAFGTEEGRAAFVSTHSGEDLVEVAMRHCTPSMRRDYIRAAQPLSTCGIPDVEARAKQIIAFASVPLSSDHDHDAFSAPEWDALDHSRTSNREN
jgi:hypothetical protein